ncbi:MAG: hypothetical protein GX640_16730 [Fibrobacter sp.]|nr:hypothetical protein [Fibrobacter sp.]
MEKSIIIVAAGIAGLSPGIYARMNGDKTDALRTLPGLQGLYMIGQWTTPYTGTVIGALAGRQIVQIICKNDKQEFKTQSS